MRRCPDGVAATVVGTARWRTDQARNGEAHKEQHEGVRISVDLMKRKRGRGRICRSPTVRSDPGSQARSCCGSRRPVDVQSAVSRQKKQSAYTETTAGSIVWRGRPRHAKAPDRGAVLAELEVPRKARILRGTQPPLGCPHPWITRYHAGKASSLVATDLDRRYQHRNRPSTADFLCGPVAC